MLDWLDIPKTVFAAIIGFVSAYGASWLAFTRFKKEKVWDEQRGAHKKIIDAFEELQYWSEQTCAQYCCEPFNSVESNQEAALREISKGAASGEFMFSSKFYQTVKDAYTKIHLIVFQIADECVGDVSNEQAMRKWDFIQAGEIGKVVEEYLPKLIRLTKPKKGLCKWFCCCQ
jgi:hypothetical protein